MRLVTYVREGTEKVGYIFDDKVIDLQGAYAAYLLSKGAMKAEAVKKSLQMIPNDMISLLVGLDRLRGPLEKAASAARNLGEKELSKVATNFASAKLKAPIPRPPKVIVSGNAYKKELGWHPLWLKPPPAVIGPEEPIILPKAAKSVVHEIELAVVLGKRGRYISEKEAEDHIAGYTILNDVTDWGMFEQALILPPGEKHIPQDKSGHYKVKMTFHDPAAPCTCKMFDTFSPIGPCITLKDQVGDVRNLKMGVKVNGELSWEGSTEKMVFQPSYFVSYASSVMTLEVGDIICIGSYMQDWSKDVLKPGDVVEGEIENIGLLRNPVKAEE